MTTGEKLAFLRRKKGLTQEELAVTLKVSRQSVSRWEMDAAFPETEKLVKLGKLFECSIDFLLNDDDVDNNEDQMEISVENCCKFIHECGYFFLATAVDNQPRLRPFGMVYSNRKALFFTTDKRKSVYADLKNNSQIELASYNLSTHKWIRISGKAQAENSVLVREEMMDNYPLLRQNYFGENEIFLAIFKLLIDKISIN